MSSRDALGKRLFQRVGRDRVELTAAGRRLFEFIEPFFVELTAVASGISAGSLGVLRMDAAALELRYILPRWIQRLRKSRPDIDIDLEEQQTPDLSRLANGKVDLIIDYLSEAPAGFALAPGARGRVPDLGRVARAPRTEPIDRGRAAGARSRGRPRLRSYAVSATPTPAKRGLKSRSRVSA